MSKLFKFQSAPLPQEPDRADLVAQSDSGAASSDGNDLSSKKILAPALSPGDIAIAQYASSGPDEFTFVALRDIEAGTTINFTDNGWLASGGFLPGEGTVTYTASTLIAAGTAVTLTGLDLDSAGDQIIAYQGDALNPTFLYAIDLADGDEAFAGDATGTTTSAIPWGLTPGLTAVAVSFDNAAYTGPGSGSQSELLAAVSNAANWTNTRLLRGVSISPFALGPDIDLDANNSTHFGNDFSTQYVPGGAPVRISDTDVRITDEFSFFLFSATITAAGGDFGAHFSVNGPLPFGIRAFFDSTTEIMTLSGFATLDAYETAIGQVEYSTTTGGLIGTEQRIQVTVFDGFQTSPEAISFIRIAPGSTPPHLDLDANNSNGFGVDYTATFTEGGPATPIADVDVLITDPDSPTLASATVRLAINRTSSDLLSINGTLPAGIAASSYDPFTGILSLTGSATRADYQTALHQVVFSNSSSTPFTGDRILEVTVNDGTATSNIGRTYLHVNDVFNVAPALNLDADSSTTGGVNYHTTFTGGGPAVAIVDTDVLIQDPDDTMMDSATIRLTNGQSGDVLAFDGPPPAGIFVLGYNPVTGLAGLTGRASLADYQAALRQFTFSTTDTSSTATRTIELVVSDGIVPSNTTNALVEIAQPVNDPPLLDLDLNDSTAPGHNYNTTFAENGAPVPVADTDVTISDPDSPDMVSARITLTSPEAGDLLTVSGALPSGISASAYDPVTGILTLTGTASLADYQTALLQVRFSTEGDNPVAGTRFVDIAVTGDDGADDTGTAQALIDVTALNDAPTLTVAASANYAENGTPVILSPLAGVVDPDDSELTFATVSITDGSFPGDLLTINGATGGTVDGILFQWDPALNALVLNGAAPVATYQAALQQVAFNSASDNPTDFNSTPTRTLLWSVSDGSATGTATTTINLFASNDGPHIDVAPTAAYTENGAPTTISPAAIATDVDSFNLTAGQVTIDAGARPGDTLTVNGLQNGTFAGIAFSYDAGTSSLSFNQAASVADYQAFLQAVQFHSTSDNPTDFGTSPTRTIAWALFDGTTVSNIATTTLNITDANDAPVNTVPAAQSVAEDTVLPIAGVAVDDPDSSTVTTTLSVSSGTLTVATDGTAVIGGDGSGSVTVTGTAAEINAALAGLAYRGNPDFNGSDTLIVATSDATFTDTDAIAITVSAVADIADDATTTNEDTAVNVLVLANDAFEGTPAITATTNGAHGTVTVSDNGTPGVTTDDFVVYSPAADFNGTDTFTYTVTSGGITETATVSVTVGAVADVVDDTATTNEDTAVNVPVLANDAFESTPAITGTTSGTHGSVTVNDNGTPGVTTDDFVVYTPAADFNGTDTFTYAATSGGITETATVSVTVGAVDDIADDSTTTSEDTAVNVLVLANDAFESTPAITGTTNGTHGSVSLNNNGTAGDTADDIVVYTPAADFNGTDTFTYTVTSGGIAETATVSVTVGAVADIADDAATTTEDTAVNVLVLANDAFEGTPAISATTNGTHGTVSLNDNGTPGNTADDFVVYTPAADFSGTDSFTYTVTSGGITETATVSVTVGAVADIVDDTATTTEDTAVNVLVLANDAFEGTPTITGTTNGAHGSVTVNDNGTAGDSADDFVVYTPAADFNGTDSFTYTVTSGGIAETATVSVTVNAAADIVDDSTITNEDTAVSVLVLANDAFEGTPAITATTNGTHGSVAVNDNGTPGDTSDDFVVYTPATDFNGADSFTYTVTSGGITETATVSVTVGAVADIVDDTATTTEDTAVNVLVLANDAFEGTPAISATTNGTHGTVSLNDNGTPGNTADDFVVYTPAADFSGTDSFTYTVTSGGITETATVSVTVGAVADIVDDTATTTEDTAVNVLVLANDAFEGTPTITGTTNGAHGSVTVNDNGTAGDSADDFVVYTPAADFNGTDSFTYTVTSGGIAETATVSVTVNAAADIVDDSTITNEDTAVSVLVLANDAFEGTPAITATTNGTHGSVAVNDNGTPGDTSDDFVVYTPAADFNGTDSFTYTVTSGGITETATVSVTVGAAADIVDDTATTTEDTAVNVLVLANDTFEGTPAITGTTNGAHGTVTVNDNGTAGNTADDFVVYTPAADFNGTDTFTYTVTSGGITETATVSVTVNAAADIVDDSTITNEDTAVSVLVLANDAFEGTPAITATTNGTHDSVAVNDNGTAGNTADDFVVYTPAADFSGTDSFTYTVTSGGITETGTVNVTVSAVADIADDTTTTNEDTAVNVLVLGNDNFEGIPAITGTTNGAHGTVAVNDNGTSSDTSDDFVVYTPAADFSGTDTFTYTVTSGGIAETATVNVTVNAAADVVDDAATTNEDTAVNVLVLANDTFEGTPAITGTTSGTHGTVAVNDNGTAGDTSDDFVVYTPAADFNGTDTFTYTVTSGGITETATVSVTVGAVGDAVDDAATTNEDTPVNVTVLANDTFEDPARSITAVGAASHGVATIDGTAVVYTPNADFNGADSFTYTVTSGGITETATVNVTVGAVGDAVDDAATTTEDTSVNVTVLANDTFEDPARSITAVGAASHGVATIDGTAVVYTPNADFNGADSFTYTVTSGGITETATVNVTVGAVADAVDDAATTTEDTAVNVTVLANDTFEDPARSITAVGAASHGVATIDGTAVVYTPNADFNGTDSFTYTVTSGGIAETATVSVTVGAVADIVDDTATTNEDTPVSVPVLDNDDFQGTPAITATTNGTSGTVAVNNNGTAGDTTDDFVVYTPNADFNGTDSFTYTVTSAGITETATVSVTVAAVADIADDTATTNEDTPVSVLVLDNDDFQGIPAITATTSGTHGTVTVNDNGTAGDTADDFVVYTPAADFNGTDTFTYTVTSGGITETATVSVTVGAVANIVDDAATTNEDTVVSILVLANDAFVGSPAITATTNGTHGSVAVNDNGTAGDTADDFVVYTPAADFNGTDSFTYTVTSGGITETGTVSVTVNAVADIVDDTATTNEDTAVSVLVLATDNFEGIPTITGTTDGAHGTVTVNDNGTAGDTADDFVVYTPAADFNGTDSFTYTVTSAGITETATVSVTVAAVADIADDSTTTSEDTAVGVPVLANDNFEGIPAITATTSGTHGTVAVNDNGTPGNTTDDFVVYTPAADFNGTDTFTYTVTSGGITETATVSVTVGAVADIADNSTTTSEDTAVGVPVLANDTFEGTPAITATTDGAHGTVTVNDNGTAGNTADDFVVYTLAADFNGTDSFTYTVASGGITETATVSVTVGAVADIADDAATTNEDTAVSILVLANDAFEGTPAITATTSGTHGTVAVNDNGTPGDTADDFVVYTPAADFNGTDTFTYTVTSGGITQTATVSVTVAAVADIADNSTTTSEDSAVGVLVLANDTFEGTPAITATTDGAHGSVTVNDNGTAGNTADDFVVYTPAADFNGTDTFTYTVTSGGITETATVNVTVGAVADIADDAATTNEDTAVSILVLANDAFEGTPAITATTSGTHGTVSLNDNGTPGNTADDFVVYTPAADFNGTDSFTYTVTSGGITETATVSVTVNAAADIVDDTATTTEDSAVNVLVLGNDNFEGIPAITGTTNGTHGSVTVNDNGTAGNTSDDFVVYTPAADFNGTDTFTYTVTSGGIAETATVSVTVGAVADIADDSTTTSEDTAVSVLVLANDTFEGTPAITATTSGTHGTVTVNDNGTPGVTTDDFVIYTPAADFNGTDSFTYTVTSGGITETATVSVTVGAVADIADDSTTTSEDTAVSVLVLANDTFEGTPAITATTDGTHGSVTVNDNGTAGNTADDFVVYTPAADFNGADTFTYTVTSGGITETATVSVTVGAVADIVDDNVTVAQDSGANNLDLLANDTFEDPARSITAVGTASHGVATIADNGTPDDTADDFVVYTPASGYMGPDTFTYVVTAAGATETATVNVVVPCGPHSPGPPSTTPTPGNDDITGTNGPDTIAALAGEDTVRGLEFDDLLYGNECNDTVLASLGNDTVYGGLENDLIEGSEGNDLLVGNEGTDTIDGGEGDNTIVDGEDSTDGAGSITAGSGNDISWGNGGDDTIDAGGGVNTVNGGVGNDTVSTGAQNDIIYGNEDGDTINAGDGANQIFAGFGSDSVLTGAGNDTIWGNEDNDTLAGGTGADRYAFLTGSGTDQIDGFDFDDGDRLDLQGQTFSTGISVDGDVLVLLSGGGTIELNQIAPGAFSPAFVV